MKLWYEDLDYTVTMTGAQPRTPATNLKSANLWPPAVSDQLSVNIDLDMGEWVNRRDYLAILGLNFDVRTTITIRGTNSSSYTGGVTDTISILTGLTDPVERTLTTGETRTLTTGETRTIQEAIRNENIVYENDDWLLNYRYIRITITNTVDPVSVDKIMIGKSLEMPYGDPGFSTALNDNTIKSESFTGQEYNIEGIIRNSFTIGFNLMSPEKKKEVEEMYNYVKTNKAFLMTFFEGSLSKYPPTYVRINQPQLRFQNIQGAGRLFSTSIAFREGK